MQRARACLLTIGDELLAGDIIDRNAAEMATALRSWGFELRQKRTVRDRVEEIVTALHELAAEADVILTTGGLGPTSDDMTAYSVAKAAGVQLRRDPEAQAQLELRFAAYIERHALRLGEASAKALIEANLRQVDFPIGSERLDNPIGSAPGFALELRPPRPPADAPDHRCWVAAMPGVPVEMRRMLAEQVGPRLAARFGARTASRRVYRVMGDGESAVARRIEATEAKLEHDPSLRGVILHYRAHTPEILLTFEALADESGARASTDALEALDADLFEQLGEELFSVGEDELPNRLVRALASSGLRLATAESCTGGGVGAMVTEVPGSSAVFVGGLITYANEAKIEQLDVPRELIEAHGAVSPEVARAMALGAARRFGSDLAIGITGIAGPGGGTPDKPVGTVHVAVCRILAANSDAGADAAGRYPDQTTEPKITHRHLRLRGNRGTVRRSAALWALKMVWDQLLEEGLATRVSPPESPASAN